MGFLPDIRTARLPLRLNNLKTDKAIQNNSESEAEIYKIDSELHINQEKVVEKQRNLYYTVATNYQEDRQMAVVDELLRGEADGAISFGNHKLAIKAKVEDFRHAGDLLKVKTYSEITKLEKNGMFLYESVPGTSVVNFKESETGVEFVVEGDEDAQITVGLTDDTEYEVFVADISIGTMKTGLGGKLSMSVELTAAGEVPVKIVQA